MADSSASRSALSLAILARRPLGQLDAGLLGQPLERLAEVEAVAAHQEGEDVPALATAEAAPRLPIGVDDERRGLLGVEGAESLVGGTGALELDRLADDLEHAELRFDLGDDAGGAHAEARIPFDGLVVKYFVNSARSIIADMSSPGRGRACVDHWTDAGTLGGPSSNVPTDVPYRMTSTSSPTDAATLRSAFRDVHAARLHGFALLVTCGDGEAAAHLTNTVLGAHASRIAVARHPERAAAALRAELAASRAPPPPTRRSRRATGRRPFEPSTSSVRGGGAGAPGGPRTSGARRGRCRAVQPRGHRDHPRHLGRERAPHGPARHDATTSPRIPARRPAWSGRSAHRSPRSLPGLSEPGRRIDRDARGR